MFLVLSDLFPTRVLTIQFSAGFCFNLKHILKQLRVSVKHDGAKIKFVSQPQSSRGLPGPHHHPRPLNSLSAFRSPCKFADHLAILEFKCKIHCIQSCSEEGRQKTHPYHKQGWLAHLAVSRNTKHTHTQKNEIITHNITSRVKQLTLPAWPGQDRVPWLPLSSDPSPLGLCRSRRNPTIWICKLKFKIDHWFAETQLCRNKYVPPGLFPSQPRTGGPAGNLPTRWPPFFLKTLTL